MPNEMIQGFTVTLPNEVSATIVPAITAKVKDIIITRFVDEPAQKRVTAFTGNGLGAIILWEGTAYDAIGDWTNANVVARLNEIYK